MSYTLAALITTESVATTSIKKQKQKLKRDIADAITLQRAASRKPNRMDKVRLCRECAYSTPPASNT